MSRLFLLSLLALSALVCVSASAEASSASDPCVIGFINHCTGESAAWNEGTEVALGGVAQLGASPVVKDPRALVAAGRQITYDDLTVQQAANMRAIMAEAGRLGITNVNQKAYILGTAEWESFITPIEEWGGPSKHYAPYYGRGFVQLTWRENYAKFTTLLKTQRGITADLVAHPELALNPANAAFIIAYGMKHGSFTGVKLDNFFYGNTADWLNARRIVNGMDQAELIGKLSKLFLNLAKTL